MTAAQSLTPALSDALPVVDAGAPRRAPMPAAVVPAANAPALSTLLPLPLLRRSLPGIAGIVLLAVFVLLFLWIDEGDYRVLYPGMSDVDRGEAFELLTTAGLPVKVDQSTGNITVALDQYYEARMALASAGLPRDAASGSLDWFNDQSSMTTSQFMEEAKYSAAIENELAKSIIKIATIQSARVHLATPRQSAFVRNRIPTKASVVVVPHAGRSVSQAQVQAITHLVASSVPYLAVSDVSVVDQQGNLLTNSMTPTLNQATQQSTYERSVEEDYRNRIESLLAPLVGLGNVKVDVDLAMDFTELESTFEEYDQNGTGPKSRSEVLVVDRSTSAAPQGVPGAASNIAPNDTLLTPQDPNQGNDAGVNGVSSSRTTRNYELDRSIRYVRNQAGQIVRLSVAVVINDQAFAAPAEDAEGEIGSPLAGQDPEAFTAKVSDLVRAAVGFDQTRGDSVTVVTSPFVVAPVVDTTTPWYTDAHILSMIKYGAGLVAFLVLALAVLRPLMRVYHGGAATARAGGGSLGDGELSDAERQLLSMGNNAALEEIKAKLKPRKSSISADMLDTANSYDDKVALVRLLVAEDSARVANVLKKMIKPA